MVAFRWYQNIFETVLNPLRYFYNKSSTFQYYLTPSQSVGVNQDWRQKDFFPFVSNAQLPSKSLDVNLFDYFIWNILKSIVDI